LAVGVAGISWRLRRWLACAYVVLSLLLVGVGIDAFFIEPGRLQISHVELTSSKLDRPVRIVVVADLQTDEMGDYERRALDVVAAEKPDLVLFAGDYIQEFDETKRRRLFAEFRKILAGSGLPSPMAAFAVRGNIDPGNWHELFAEVPVTTCEETTQFDVAGLHLTALSQPDSRDPTLSVPAVDGFHVVLGHHPDFARGDVRADLLIAGHTHGGQVRLPLVGPLMTLSRIPRRWAAGVTQLEGGRTLVVSRGIGMERGDAPRLRFLCRPEIVVIEMQPTPVSGLQSAK
jgi:predicted MPP superfamily phosphohydrolase